MNFRRYLLFIFFTLFFLFYPGDSFYYTLFMENHALFAERKASADLTLNPVPLLKSNVSPQLSAEGVYIVDLPSFTPVYKHNENEARLPASTTKVITALVAYDIYKPDDVLTVKKVITEGQIMGLIPGEKITVENLLYGTLVHSGNDAADVLAQNYGYEKFIDLMNKKAQSLGMKNSVFHNPTGLEQTPENMSTPFDLALAARELLKNKLLSKIVSTKEITIGDVDFKIFHRLSNVNKLLGEIQGIGGLKTGYTEHAGENLISFYKKNGHQFIIVILKSQDRFSDTTNVVNWIENNITYVCNSDLKIQCE